MKKKLVLSILIILLSISMLYAVAPVSKHVGVVDTFPASGSITAKAIEALRSDFSAEWFETYTTGDKAMIDFWSETLIDILPLNNLIAGVAKDDAVSLYDLEKQVFISLTFTDGHLISSMDIER